MNKKLIGYWLATALFCLAMAAGGTMNLMRVEMQKESMTALGYPEYLMTILGVAKLSGAAALLAPGLARLKEWAYAGFAFDLLGATVSHAAVGDPASDTLRPFVVLLVAAASYALRPAGRRLAG